MKTLRPYQIEADAFLKAHPHAGLFIDMGLGKTAATLHALTEFPEPILLVAPIRVIETVWEAEAGDWQPTAGLSFSLLRGSKTARKLAVERDADVYMVNPELLEEALSARSYGSLVVDESSMFKNPSTTRFKTLRRHLKSFTRRVILTGTPSPNSLMDLWAQIFILDLGKRLDTSFTRFKQRFFYPTDYMGYKWEPKPGAEEEILRLISDLIFRVSAEGNLPPRQVIDNPIRFSLKGNAARIYNDLEKEAFSALASEQTLTAANAAAAMMKLRQVASGFVYDDDREVVEVHRDKIKIVEEILAETGSPVILVYQFRHELEALKKAFPQGRDFSPEALADWNKGKVPLLFLHPASGGHGINLQYGGHTMVIFSGSFSLEQMSQTKARIDRQGQKAPVIFHWIIAEGTVDELIMEVLDSKEKNQANVLKRIHEYAKARV